MSRISPITVEQQAASLEERALLQSLFSSPGYSLLKQVLAAHCIANMVEAMESALYDNDPAEERYTFTKTKASQHQRALDILDEIEGSEEQWFTVKLEHRR